MTRFFGYSIPETFLRGTKASPQNLVPRENDTGHSKEIRVNYLLNSPVWPVIKAILLL
jgi:hypothetical protein